MANIFLDANIVVDIFERDTKIARTFLQHNIYISNLSIHILAYLTKIEIPSLKLTQMTRDLGLINLSTKILFRSLEGPTDDLEDNIQLHSATEVGCDYFVTRDKLLLKMAYFGKMQIVDSISPAKT